MKVMEDTDVLQHLLEVEKQAALLVDDAQVEADRRIREAEEQHRLAYDGVYRGLMADLETEYQKKVEAANSEYDQSLAEYRRTFEEMPKDGGAFSSLAFSLLVRNK
jgi:vacuolar-type H+-ATPase subunit H